MESHTTLYLESKNQTPLREKMSEREAHRKAFLRLINKGIMPFTEVLQLFLAILIGVARCIISAGVVGKTRSRTGISNLPMS